jgi:hypothetical protein
MANYPSLTQTAESGEDWIDDNAIDRSVNGTAKGRIFFTTKKRGFSIRHVLTAAEKSTLASFYDTNRALYVTLTWAGDGAQYDCLFERPPQFRYLGAGLWDAEVRLLQK